MINRNRASGVNTDIAQNSLDLEKAQKLAEEAAATKAAADTFQAAISAKRERYWQLRDPIIPNLREALEHAVVYIEGANALEAELADLAIGAISNVYTGGNHYGHYVLDHLTSLQAKSASRL